ncbi:hypothetical protein HPB49_021452 [Dermacentor silvarum]|uniref:Uncharacterized protein n=1 Tax=Dermacentor silvarum TaxID=543639 RepID=A0ACB8DRD6_DERSI|nr:hypothetical protein HPB49_021452 [Dermacentor silvarum]
MVTSATRKSLNAARDMLLHSDGKSAVVIPEAFRQFYSACYHFLAAQSAPSLSAILEPLKEHAAILDMKDFSQLLERAIELSLGWGVHVFFKLGIAKSADRVHLVLSTAQSLRQKLDPEGDLLRVSEEVRFLLDVALAGTPFRTSVLNILKLSDALTPDDESEPALMLPVTKLGTLSDSLDTERWLRGINSFLLPQYRVGTQSAMMTNQFGRIESVIATVHSIGYDGRVYAYLQVLAELARFHFARQQGPAVERATTCFFAGAEVFGHSWARMFLEVTSAARTCERTYVTFRQIVRRASHNRAMTWMDEASRTSYLGVLRKVELLVYNKNVTASSYGEHSWSGGAAMFPEDFMREKRHAQKRLLRNPNPLFTDLRDSLLFAGRVAYSRPLVAVVVPAAVSTEPFCYSSMQVPSEFDLSMLGTLVAIELSRVRFVHFLEGYHGLEKRTELDSFSECIKPIADTVLTSPPNHTSQSFIREAFLWVRGATLAFETLKDIVFRAGVMGFAEWRTAQRTFFRRFCLLACNSKTGPGGLSPEARCLLPLANIPEFSKAFECPVHSVMRQQPCDVI